MISKAILLATPGYFPADPELDGPVTKVGDLPLLKRNILALDHQGVHDVFVIIDAGAACSSLDAFRGTLAGDPDITSNIRWIDARAGSELGSIRPLIDEPTLVVGANLVFGPEMLSPVVDSAEDRLAKVFVDRALARIFDVEHAIKVRTRGSLALDLGPAINVYDAVAVGIGVVTPDLLEAFPEVADPKELIQRAARAGVLRIHAVDQTVWQTIHDRESLRHAAWLIRACGGDLWWGQPQRAEAAAHVPSRTLAYIEGLLSESQPKHNVLLNPGPVVTSARVKSALVHHDVCHRDEDYATVVRRIQRKVRRVCRGGPAHEVMLISGSGTAAIEATISSCVARDGRLLVISNGAFGERFAEIADLHRIDFHHLRYEWGELVDVADVERLLAGDPQISAVIMCHHETSVGILNPLDAVGALCRRYDRLFFVDSVSSLGAEELDVRRDRIDVLISSANKCLHAISGVSFVCVAPRVWPMIESIAPRVYYLDLKRYRGKQIPFTPAVSNFFALDAALDELLRDGVATRIRSYKAVNKRMRRELSRLGLKTLTKTGHESHSITTLAVPSYISYDELYGSLKRRGYVVYGCKEHLKDRYFQIANMGELSDEMVQGFFDTLEVILQQHKRAAEPRRVAM